MNAKERTYSSDTHSDGTATVAAMTAAGLRRDDNFADISPESPTKAARYADGYAASSNNASAAWTRDPVCAATVGKIQ